MPFAGIAVPISKKILPIIFVIDASTSMKGEKINSVNSAIKESIEILKDFSNSNPDASLAFGVLAFSTEPVWMTNGLQELDDLMIDDIVAKGRTNLGKALLDIKEKFNKEHLFDAAEGYMAPVLIFMSDGRPIDSWKRILNDLNKNNRWFKASTKIGIAIGKEADIDILSRVVGNRESVITVNNLTILSDLIKIVSMTSSIVSSQSKLSASKPASVEIIKKAIESVEKDDVDTADNIEEKPIEDDKNDIVGEDDFENFDFDDNSGW